MKFKQMTVICNNIEKLREIYFNKCVNAEYIVDVSDVKNICEIAKNELKIMQICDAVVLSVNEFCSVEDMLGVLKSHNLNAIVLENSATTYDKKYIGFKTLDELIDFVVNEKKKFKFIDSTAEILSKKHSTDGKKIKELYTVSGDTNILAVEVKEAFIF